MTILATAKPTHTSRIYRLTGAENREWRENRSFWVTPNDWTVLRELTKKELDDAFSLSKGKVKKIVKMEEEGRIYELKSSRELMRRRIFEERGEVIVKYVNGSFCCRLIDPNRPKARLRYESGVLMEPPKIENCSCKNREGREPGRHHPSCEWNPYVPVSEQAEKNEPKAIVIEKPEKPSRLFAETIGGVQEQGALSALHNSPAPTLVDPEVCQCKPWQWTDSENKCIERPFGKHHPVCGLREAWEASHPEPLAKEQSSYSLLLLDTGEIMRDATNDETREGLEHEKEHGTPLLIRDEVQYLIVPKS